MNAPEGEEALPANQSMIAQKSRKRPTNEGLLGRTIADNRKKGRVIMNSHLVSLTRSPSLPMRMDARRSSHAAVRSRGVICHAKKYHTVQKGEWLSSIAPQYDVTTEKLRDANVKAIGEGDLIFPGQQLVIPAAGSGVKGILVKIIVALVVAAAAGIWPTIKEQMK